MYCSDGSEENWNDLSCFPYFMTHLLLQQHSGKVSGVLRQKGIKSLFIILQKSRKKKLVGSLKIRHPCA
jgi:hypothetical protein